MLAHLSKATVHSYSGPRLDLQQLIPHTAKHILDVGCGPGTLGKSLQERQPCFVDGIEPHPILAQQALTQLDRVLPLAIEDALETLRTESALYDIIIFGDVLEHLIDPWKVLAEVRDLLTPNGAIVASLPNIRHVDTLYNLLVRGTWPMRERGIHDRTHLRFFTRRDIETMFRGAGFHVQRWEANYRIFEDGRRWNNLSSRLAIWPWRELLAFQYLIYAVKS